MDPFATALSVYLNFVNSITYGRVADTIGLEVQAVVINYDGMDIPFQHQRRKVRERSVCDTYRAKMSAYSDCTVKAQALFNELCSELSRKPRDHWKYAKTKNMYCNAAISYKPTVAAVSGPTEETPLELARQRCNAATAKALGTADATVLAKQQAICKEYSKMRER